MIVGVLSGKGGTGKTTLSVNLSDISNGTYVDCDVEEPNGFLFNSIEKIESEKVITSYPEIDKDICSGCGECANACNFNALMTVGDKVIVFPKLCHDCGACEIVCPSGAVSFKERKIGVLQSALLETNKNQKKLEDKIIYRGVLDIGEPMAVPIIKSLMKKVVNRPENKNPVIIDCAPGTSCNIVTTVEYLDKAVVVAEPSLFSLADMKRTVRILRESEVPFGVVINKAQKEINLIEKYCEDENIKVLGRIEFSRKVAEKYSRGEKIIDIEEYRIAVEKIWDGVKEM